jgi:DNA-binding transcriptional LysR family regulator
MDRIKLYRTFLEVAELGSFTAASDRTGLSSASVTRAIQLLEQQLGVRLFNRNTRVVRLSPAGQAFLGDVRRILSEIEEAEAAVSGSHCEPSGSLSVTAPAMFGRLFIAPLLAGFAQKYPQVVVHSLFVDRIVDVIEEGIDVAVRIANLADSTLRATEIGSVRRHLCASPKLIDRLGAPRVLDDLFRLGGIELTFASSQQQWSFVVGGKVRLVRPPMRMSVNTVEAAVAAVREGVGVARLLSYQVASEIRSGDIVVLLPESEPSPVPVHLVTVDGARSNARVRAFVEFASSRIRGLKELQA